MNGTGTKESPYIIMNVDDLYSMGTVGGNDIYFSLGADIDMNDTQYAEKFVPIPINCKKFTGNNHVIKNINYVNPDGNASIFTVVNEDENNTLTVESLKTENIRLAGKKVFLFGNAGGNCSISLEHCVFVINDLIAMSSEQASKDKRYSLIHDINITVSSDYCTFVIKAEFVKTYPMFSGDTVSHTQVKIVIHTNTFATTFDAYNAFLSGSAISDSYFFLKVTRSSSSSVSETMDFASTSCIFNRSYIVFEIVSGVSLVCWYGHLGSTCFYDRDLFIKGNAKADMKCATDTASNFHALSTEKCKDAVYLRSIGFNCVGADE